MSLAIFYHCFLIRAVFRIGDLSLYVFTGSVPPGPLLERAPWHVCLLIAVPLSQCVCPQTPAPSRSAFLSWDSVTPGHCYRALCLSLPRV